MHRQPYGLNHKGEVKIFDKAGEALGTAPADRFIWQIIRDLGLQASKVGQVIFEPNQEEKVWEQIGSVSGAALAFMAGRATSQVRVSFPEGGHAGSQAGLQASRLARALGETYVGRKYGLGRVWEQAPSPLDAQPHSAHRKIVEAIQAAQWRVSPISDGPWIIDSMLSALNTEGQSRDEIARQKEYFPKGFVLDIELDGMRDGFLPEVGMNQARWYNVGNETEQAGVERGGVSNGLSMGLTFQNASAGKSPTLGTFSVDWIGTSTGPVDLGLRTVQVRKTSHGMRIERE